MKLRYEERRILKGYHKDSITALCFCSDNEKLASCSIDGTLCIWSTQSTDPLCVVTSQVGFTSLVWVSETIVYSGREDGVIIIIQLLEVRATNI